MASKTLGSLIVDLEMQTAKFDKKLSAIDRKIGNFEKKTNKSIATVKKAFGGLIAFEAVRRATVGILQIADRMTELQGRVKNATRDTGDFNTVWKQLGSIAAETGTELDTTVQVFQRLVLARKELQTTNADMLQFTKTVQQLGVISGASTGALRAGLTQLAQGLSAGTLRAEEFNSIVENIPAVAKAIADGMGLSVGQLRNMVLEGKVLSTDVLAAILSQTSEVNQQMGEMPLTIARATTQLNLAWSQFIVQLDESIEGSSRLAKIIQGITLVLKDWSVEANSFNEKIGFIKRQINELSSQPDFLRNFLGTNERIEELQQQLHVLTRGQLPDLVREGKEAGRILNEMGDAAGDAAGKMETKNKVLTAQEKKALADAKAMEEQAAAAKKLAKEYEILASLTSKTSAFDESVGGKTGGVLSADNLDRANDRLKEIQKGVVGIDAATGKLITTQDALNRELEKQAELAKLFEITWTEVMEDTIRSVRGAWSDFFYDVFQGEGIDSFKDFVDKIKDLFLRLIADLAAAWVTRNIFGGLLGIGGGSIFTGGAGILGGAASGGGGLLGGLLGGGAATSSGAGGAAVGGVAIAGAAGGAATVFPYVSATGTGVGGVIGGTALTGTGATVTSGAGGAAAAGTGALGGAAAALPYVGIMALALHLATSGGRNIGDILKGQTNFAKFGPGAGGATYDRADPFLESLQGRGLTGPGGPVNVTDVGSGLGFTSRTGREGDPLVNVQEMFEAFERLKDILPEIQAAGMEAFEGMKVPAEEMTEILGDGWVNAQERITLGLEGITGGIGSMGRVTTEQFGQIAAAVNNGELRLKALAGTVKFTENELKILGEIGVRSIDDISGSANALQSDLGEAKGAANSLANAIRDIPSIPSGARDIGGKHSGGSFEVRGRPGVDANLVQFMATAGERVTVKTPGTTEHAQAGADMSGLVNRMDRLISYLEAA